MKFADLPVGTKFTRANGSLEWTKWELFRAYGTVTQNAAAWGGLCWHYDLIDDNELVTVI